MKYTEELLWILDKVGKKLKADEEYQQNIEFVHSLGLKCDCVGWSELNLADPGADDILKKIDAFCNENGWRARGIYTREYTEVESDWYELLPVYFKDNTLTDCIETKSKDGKKIFVSVIRTYYEMNAAPKIWRRFVCSGAFSRYVHS